VEGGLTHAARLEIRLTDEEKAILQQWSRSRSTEARLVERAQIVLMASDGVENKDIAGELGITRATVSRWRNRFAERGIAGIEKDGPRGGRPPKARDQLVRKIIEMTTQQKPANATHWSTRTLAEVLGTNRSMVSRVWRAHGLKPHLVRTFKVSNESRFTEKLVDVVGLYLDPPAHALVLSVDEKSQIQALDRTQKSLPIYPGRCETMTHDYKRDGTTTLFAALDVVEGRLIGQCMTRHRHQEFIKFIKQIDSETRPELDLHLIVDTYATHKHPNVQKCLKRHRRFHLHFIPTSSSWLNLVERWVPGHMTGHVVIVARSEDLTYVLAGDLTFRQHLLLDDVVCGMTENLPVSLASQRAMKQFAHNEPTVLLPAHNSRSRQAAGRRLACVPAPASRTAVVTRSDSSRPRFVATPRPSCLRRLPPRRERMPRGEGGNQPKPTSLDCQQTPCREEDQERQDDPRCEVNRRLGAALVGVCPHFEEPD
jgi:transposase